VSEFHFSPRPNRAGEIAWRVWGADAFDEARRADKPVLLAISAVWCHWCHVMDETTYSSQDVIDEINQRFIPVRVDNDRRPDINARYNQGGWPTTVVLTPDGEVLKGATYVPPEQMNQLLTQIGALYSDASNRLAIANFGRDAKARRQAASRPAAGALNLEIADRIFSFIDAEFDEAFAGFGSDQKFPQTNVLHFLLDLFARRRDPRSREMAQRTLHAMSDGGMYDRVEGGFFRYATNRDFSVPHFEKMLEDLSELLLASARAKAMFGDPELGRIALDVRSYLDASLWNDRLAGYGGSQDADEEYYRRDAQGRARMARPYVDPTLYTSWNAQTARALIASAPLLGFEKPQASEWTARGVAVLDALWSNVLSDGLMCRFYDGEAHVRGLLCDQAASAWAALAAFEGTGDVRWLERAKALATATDVLYVAEAGAYADRLHGQGAEPDRLAETTFLLDENALMARALLALEAFTAERSWGQRARTVLESQAQVYRTYGRFAAGYGSAILDTFAQPLDVMIVGPPFATRTVSLRDAARGIAFPPVRVDVIGPSEFARLEALGQVASKGAVAYVCSDSTCFGKASAPDELVAALSHAQR